MWVFGRSYSLNPTLTKTGSRGSGVKVLWDFLPFGLPIFKTSKLGWLSGHFLSYDIFQNTAKKKLVTCLLQSYKLYKWIFGAASFLFVGTHPATKPTTKVQSNTKGPKLTMPQSCWKQWPSAKSGETATSTLKNGPRKAVADVLTAEHFDKHQVIDPIVHRKKMKKLIQVCLSSMATATCFCPRNIGPQISRIYSKMSTNPGIPHAKWWDFKSFFSWKRSVLHLLLLLRAPWLPGPGDGWFQGMMGSALPLKFNEF